MCDLRNESNIFRLIEVSTKKGQKTASMRVAHCCKVDKELTSDWNQLDQWSKQRFVDFNPKKIKMLISPGKVSLIQMINLVKVVQQLNCDITTDISAWCSLENPCTYCIMKRHVHWRNLKIFSRTTCQFVFGVLKIAID